MRRPRRKLLELIPAPRAERWSVRVKTSRGKGTIVEGNSWFEVLQNACVELHLEPYQIEVRPAP